MPLPIKARIANDIVVLLQSLTGMPERLSVGLVVTPCEGLNAQETSAIKATLRGGDVACEIYFGDDERTEEIDTHSNISIFDFPVALCLHLPDKPVVHDGGVTLLEPFQAAADIYGRVSDAINQNTTWPDDEYPSGKAQETTIMGGGGGPFIHDVLKTQYTTSVFQVRYRVTPGNSNQAR